MVAEKWPHKKAIKEHKGSEFRAQCDISRKWDICVHGARPTFDMFTRVGWGAVAVGQDTGVTLGKTALRCSQIREHKRLHQGVKRVAGREKPTSVAHVAAKGDVGAKRLPFISSVLSEKPPLSHTACFWSLGLATVGEWLVSYPTMF